MRLVLQAKAVPFVAPPSFRFADNTPRGASVLDARTWLKVIRQGLIRAARGPAMGGGRDTMCGRQAAPPDYAFAGFATSMMMQVVVPVA